MDELDALFEEDLGFDQDDDLPQNEPLVLEEEDNFLSDVGIDDNPIETNDLVSNLLKQKGITDNKISILDENNEEKKVDFYSLPMEEQLQILTDKENDFSTEEAQFLQTLRKNNLSIEDFLANYKEEILKTDSNQESSYQIDDFTDEELFLMDLKYKFENLTDEELGAELNKELQNKAIFDKKVSKLRDEYKTLEDGHKQAQEESFRQNQEEQYNKFANTMVDIAVKTGDLYGIELEDAEKNEVLSFILDLDDKGTSEFYKNLNDPKKLYEVAWFMKYGKEAFDAIQNAYEAEITNLKKDKSQAVIRPKGRNIESIYDI